jgi:PKD repeat protein
MIGFSSLLSTVPSSNSPGPGASPGKTGTVTTAVPTTSGGDSFWVRHTPAGFQAGFSNADVSGSGTLLNAGIGFFPQSGSAPLTVRFTDKSRGFPSSWSWDFGDGTKSSEESPAHTYTSAGTYYVDLTVSGDGVKSSARAGPFIVRAPGSGGATTLSEMSEQVGRAVLKYTNIERAKRNLPPLTWTSQLAVVAKAHSELMASTGMISHLLPGEMPLQTRLIDGGVPNAGAGENLAMVESGSDPDAIGADCVYEWVWDDASENWGHRHNILDGITSDPGYNDHPASEDPDGYGNSGYKQMGAGGVEGTVVQNGKTFTVIFVTQDFLPG